jgi:4-hydroxythreonine-4-phosphate dehydrogenase
MPLSRRGEEAGSKLPIVISQGEPAGIGPEVAVKAWTALGGAVDGRPLKLIGSRDLFLETVRRCRLDASSLADAVIDTGATIVCEPGKTSCAQRSSGDGRHRARRASMSGR